MGQITKKSEFLLELSNRIAKKRQRNLDDSYKIASALLNSDSTHDLQELQERYNHCLSDDLYYQRLQRDVTAWYTEAIELERKEAREYLKDEWESGEECEDNTNDYEEE